MNFHKSFLVGAMLALFLLSGCGYKPSVTYTREVLGEKIYAQVAISRRDPKNSVLIGDALNDAVISRFGARLSDKENADTSLYITIGSIGFTPILYDDKGYVISYKASVSLNTLYIKSTGEKSNFSTVGEFDFPIEANSVISDSKRFEAIRLSAIDALNEVVSKISLQGMHNGKHD